MVQKDGSISIIDECLLYDSNATVIVITELLYQTNFESKGCFLDWIFNPASSEMPDWRLL